MGKITMPQFPLGRFNKIALIGEAPGREEDEQGLPFVGAAGKSILNPLLKQAGIDRPSCYIGNIVRERPPGNNFSYFENNRPDLIKDGLEKLERDLELWQPNVIVALGRIPMKYLTGIDDSITNWRGSILPSIAFSQTYKVIPTFHPAGILRQYDNAIMMLFDLKRVAGDAASPDLNLTARNLQIRPTFLQAMDYLGELLDCDKVAFDIEVIRNMEISCLGFAKSPHDAMCIPLISEVGDYFSVTQEAEIWRATAEVLESRRTQKIIHNMMFENFILKYLYDIEIENVFDTMIAGHILYPELPNSLAFSVSMYTREPYYKHEGKGEKIGRSEWSELYTYNCKDCVVSHEIASPMDIEMAKYNLYAPFMQEMKSGFAATKMQLNGITPDIPFMTESAKRCEQEKKTAKEELSKLVGYDVNPDSPKQVKELLYDKLKLPERISQGKLTTNVDAINDLAFKFNKPELQHILDYRSGSTEKGFYTHVLDPRDNKIRISHNPAGQKGARWSTSKNIFGYGRNMQNLPKEARAQVIAANGYFLAEMDAMQIESRIVAYYAKCILQMTYFETGQDIHSITAASLFNKPIEEISKDSVERYLGKTCNHSSNYGIAGAKLARKIFKESGLRFEASVIQKYIDGYHSLYPEIKENFWTAIEEDLSKTRTIRNPFGRLCHFWGRQSDMNMKFEAYNYIPQSTTADIISKVINRIFAETDARALLHTHDGILMEIPLEQPELLKVIYDFFNIPVPIHGVDRFFPVEVAVGKTWGHLDSVDANTFTGI